MDTLALVRISRRTFPCLRRLSRAPRPAAGAWRRLSFKATLGGIVAAPERIPARRRSPRLGLLPDLPRQMSSANIEEDPEGLDADNPADVAKAQKTQGSRRCTRQALLSDRDGRIHARRGAGYCKMSTSAEDVERLVRRGLWQRSEHGDSRRCPHHRGRADHRHGHRDDGGVARSPVYGVAARGGGVGGSRANARA